MSQDRVFALLEHRVVTGSSDPTQGALMVHVFGHAKIAKAMVQAHGFS